MRFRIQKNRLIAKKYYNCVNFDIFNLCIFIYIIYIYIYSKKRRPSTPIYTCTGHVFFTVLPYKHRINCHWLGLRMARRGLHCVFGGILWVTRSRHCWPLGSSPCCKHPIHNHSLYRNALWRLPYRTIFTHAVVFGHFKVR